MGISDDVIGDVIGASKKAKIADASEFIPAYSLYFCQNGYTNFFAIG